MVVLHIVHWLFCIWLYYNFLHCCR